MTKLGMQVKRKGPKQEKGRMMRVGFLDYFNDFRIFLSSFVKFFDLLGYI